MHRLSCFQKVCEQDKGRHKGTAEGKFHPQIPIFLIFQFHPWTDGSSKKKLFTIWSHYFPNDLIFQIEGLSFFPQTPIYPTKLYKPADSNLSHQPPAKTLESNFPAQTVTLLDF